MNLLLIGLDHVSEHLDQTPGGKVGNWLGGRLADWSLDGATRLFLGALAAIMLLLPFASAVMREQPSVSSSGVWRHLPSCLQYRCG